MRKAVFPFTAVLGQENIKKALIWNLVNPAVGGVLIAGEKVLQNPLWCGEWRFSLKNEKS